MNTTNTAEGPPRADPALGETDQRERMIHELEEHAPEGPATPRTIQLLEGRILIPLIVLATVAVLALVYQFGNWPAVMVGVVLVSAWYWLGWWPEIRAATDRRRERREFEDEVSRRLRGGGTRPASGA